jgi:hypothetical protein
VPKIVLVVAPLVVNPTLPLIVVADGVPSVKVLARTPYVAAAPSDGVVAAKAAIGPAKPDTKKRPTTATTELFLIYSI